MVPIADITLNPVSGGSWFRVRRWLTEPDVIGWWGSKAAADAAMAIAATSPTAVVRSITLSGNMIGYAHALDLEVAGLPPGTWHADAFIGLACHRGQGFGAAALALLRDELFASTLASALAVRISIRNESQVRAIERAGFRWHAVAPDASLGPCWMMVAERA